MLRNNPAPLYFRLRAALGLFLVGALGLGASSLGLGRKAAPQPGTAGTKLSSNLIPAHLPVPTGEGLTLKDIDAPRGGGVGLAIDPVLRGDAQTDPHSFLPYSIEAGPGRATHPRKYGHPSSLARSRLTRPSSLAAYGPDLPLALAIPQDKRPFLYPALCRESSDKALRSSNSEVRLRASACLAESGDSTFPKSTTASSPDSEANSATNSQFFAYQYLEEKAEDLLPRDVLSPLLGFRHPTASRNS